MARMALLLADFPVEVGGLTVNRLCGSGLQAINSAAHAIAVGRRRRVHRRRRRIDVPGPYVQLKAESAVRARRPAARRHHARLAVREPAAGGEAPPVLDGRDRRERRRALGHLVANARTPSRSRASAGPPRPSRPAGSTTSSSRSRSRSGRAIRSSWPATSTRARTRARRRSRSCGRPSRPKAAR